jgi:hypothetical protein
MRATRLGRYPISGCIVEDPNWWKEQNNVSIYCLVVFFQVSWHNSYNHVVFFSRLCLGVLLSEMHHLT